ncbi:hypothetical protein NDU88_008081 [Pleurodeles waltl]|uniref:Uncharacterized protein n=1 Tax=Pleurodeles waltl TaxID=8319 RepID=A0AAV7SU74_PLEWA|nr:hypothetical protein NDU88_008081 [Pleurodeles waltl]
MGCRDAAREQSRPDSDGERLKTEHRLQHRSATCRGISVPPFRHRHGRRSFPTRTQPRQPRWPCAAPVEGWPPSPARPSVPCLPEGAHRPRPARGLGALQRRGGPLFTEHRSRGSSTRSSRRWAEGAGAPRRGPSLVEEALTCTVFKAPRSGQTALSWCWALEEAQKGHQGEQAGQQSRTRMEVPPASPTAVSN